MTIVDLRLIGPFEARDARYRAIHLPSRKMRALLAFLALHPGRRFTRKYLAALLWGDDSPENARHSLRQALSILRRECPQLEVQPQFVRLPTTAIRVDVLSIEQAATTQDFEELDRAAMMMDGELLEDHENDSEMFEQWLYPERERVRALVRNALVALIHLLAKREQHDRGIHLAGQLVNDDPFDEASHRLYLSVLGEARQQRAALKHYRDLREFLMRELGAEPEEATRSIAERLLMNAPSHPDTTSLLESTAQHLTNLQRNTEGCRQVLILSSTGEIRCAEPPIDKATANALTPLFRQALHDEMRSGVIAMATREDQDDCILIPLHGRLGNFEGAIALLASFASKSIARKSGISRAYEQRTQAPKPPRKLKHKADALETTEHHTHTGKA